MQSTTDSSYVSPLTAAVFNPASESKTTTQKESDSLGACWSTNEASGFTTIIEVLTIVSGMILMASGFLFPIAKNVDRGEAIVLGLILGGLLLAFGVALVLMRTMAPKQAIEIFDDRLELVSKKGVRVLKWDEIQKLKTQGFTETRFSETQLMVQVIPFQGKKIGFGTDWKGDVSVLMEKLMSNCDYIVQNPEGYRGN